MAELKLPDAEGYVEIAVKGITKTWRGEVYSVDISQPAVEVMRAGTTPWREYEAGPFVTVAVTFAVKGLERG